MTETDAASTVPSTERLLDLIDAMAGRPVVLVADLVVDRFLTGTPKRISREAPVLILSYQGERIAPGGGANAAANVIALGGRPLLLGAVGDDANGSDLLADLLARGIDTAGVLVRAGYRTPTKVRILGGGRHSIKQQIVRYDIEDTLALTDADRARFSDRLAEWRDAEAGNLTTAILSDYGYGAVEPGLLPLLRDALGAKATLLCDSRYRLGEFRGLDGATPNEEEAEALLGRPIDDAPEPLAQAGRILRERLGAGFLLVTRGSRGMSLFEAGGATHLPVHGTDQVADVTGAGDTVIGTFALALAAGAAPLEAALLANYAGGIVVMKMGTATLSRGELSDAVRADPRPLEGLRWAG
ncbi:MAG TPA: PfkB family carbohydrate kinase [Thermoanaerobaculia bacterium]|jgi:rfaE bifunctional protein kinase chain/domain|nr:PfkB family carbohydrate kinase [Thermoanaerobaculia bacterium]